MRIVVCDRCGIEHRGGMKGRNVVCITFEPLSRRMDLCGDCRTALKSLLDSFVNGPAGREGAVTVWDDRCRYVGCIGRETWDRLLAEVESA